MQSRPLITAASLYREWRPPRKTTAGQDAETVGSLAPSDIAAPASTALGTSPQKGRKDCESQKTRKSEMEQSLLEMAAMSMSMAMFSWKGDNFIGSHL